MRIWDFDGVIFNSQNDFTDDFLVWNAHNKGLVATLPELHSYGRLTGSNDDDILITGRSKFQQDMVQEILTYNNLHFGEIIFSDFTSKDFQAKNFYDKYHAWKIGLITQYYGAFVVDDDEKLMNLLKKESNEGLKLIWVKSWSPDLRTIFEDYKYKNKTVIP